MAAKKPTKPKTAAAKRAAPKPANRSAIPVVPKMRGFSVLTGDVNWKEFGVTLFKSHGDGTYALIEFINFEEATGKRINGNLYGAVGRTVDLSPGGFSLRNLPSALRTIGAPPTTRDPLTILDAVNSYGAYDEDFQMYGNNANELMARAKRWY